MRTYIVQVHHYFGNDDKSTDHTHRVQMPDIKYLELKDKYSRSRWQFHQWVEKQLEKQIGSRYDGEGYNSRYYIKSIKVER